MVYIFQLWGDFVLNRSMYLNRSTQCNVFCGILGDKAIVIMMKFYVFVLICLVILFRIMCRGSDSPQHWIFPAENIEAWRSFRAELQIRIYSEHCPSHQLH